MPGPSWRTWGLSALGISPDPADLQKKFDAKHSLGFPLLSDPDHAVAEAYGVWGEKSMYGKKYEGIIRSAFLIDENGIIIQAWYKVSPEQTVPKAREALGKVREGGKSRIVGLFREAKQELRDSIGASQARSLGTSYSKK